MSDWPLPKIADSAHSSPAGVLRKAPLLARVRVVLHLRVKDRSILSCQLSQRLKHGTSKASNFNGAQFWSISLLGRTKTRLKSSVRVFFLAQTPLPLRSSARKAAIMPVFCSVLSLNVSNSWKLAQRMVFDTRQIIRSQCASPPRFFAPQARPFDTRQTAKPLVPPLEGGYPSYHRPLSTHSWCLCGTRRRQKECQSAHHRQNVWCQMKN